MNLRAPAIPLIISDPYFNIWSMENNLPGHNTLHWTKKPHRLIGRVYVEEQGYLFMGVDETLKSLKQISVDIQAMSTKYLFEHENLQVEVVFLSPLLLDDLTLLSRPISYIQVQIRDGSGNPKAGRIEIECYDELALNVRFEQATKVEEVKTSHLNGLKVGNVIQNPLNRVGDDLRMNWGYLYLMAVKAESRIESVQHPYGMIGNSIVLSVGGSEGLFLVGYDDVVSLEYFHQPLEAVWKKNQPDLRVHMDQAFLEYEELAGKCRDFSDKLMEEATAFGGEKYGEMLLLAYRQVIGGHKCCYDDKGEIIFVSKENFSNGCAATVDVSYPSIPMFLKYNTECIKGMLRPIFKYAKMDEWFYAFAPHDAGCYPVLNGQVYSDHTAPDGQMPIEECGNMLIMSAAVALKEGSTEFFKPYDSLLQQWCDYLVNNGLDPENQLCTDDFAGHLAHNCNLSIKAIMGIAGYSKILELDGRIKEAKSYRDIAQEMAKAWQIKASDGNETFRLAFDQAGSYSMKYNGVWDRLFGTGLFDEEVLQKDAKMMADNHQNLYGMVLDNRADYTKSDWLIWTAYLTEDQEMFSEVANRLWLAYHESESRVPLTDWFDTKTAKQVGFQNRTVQGGLYIGLLEPTMFI